MRGQQGDDALTPDEEAMLDSDRGNTEQLPPEAPQAEPDATPDAAAAPQEGDQAETPTQPAQRQATMVPHQALHEERELRKASDQRAIEAERRAAVLEDRWNQVLRQQQPQQQSQQQPLPERDKDPVGYLDGRLGQHEQLLQAVIHVLSGQSQQSEASRATAMLAAKAGAAEREFQATTPDYQAAYEHLIDGRRRELQAAGWTDPVEINTFMAQEAQSLTATALQKGLNPAAVVYDLAKIRGYQPRAAATAEAPAQPNSAAAEQQINTIARGQQQARGLNRVPGAAAAPNNANAVANMSDEEFDAFRKKISTAELARIMGV